MQRKESIRSRICAVLAAVFAFSLILSVLPIRAEAASSSEIRKQINALKEEKDQIKDKIKEVEEQYQENKDELADILARKNVIDQQVQLLTTEITNTNEQIAAYNILIADKQDELDNAEGRYDRLNEENRVRVRTMEEDGEISYWEVLFKANSFSDLLDRLNMVEEIASADQRRIKELSDAKDAVGVAQDALVEEKAGLEEVKADLDCTEAELDEKREEAMALMQELLAKADDLEALKLDFMQQEEDFLNEIAKKEVEFNAAKQAEWEAYMATYVPPTTQPTGGVGGTTGSDDGSSSGNSGSTGGGTSSGSTTWLVPCSYTSITSPFGYRTSPTAGASTYHQGVDLDTGTGWPVVATRAGVVTIAGWSNSAGNYVQINHQDGFSSIYMHLSSIGVKSGQIVSAGQYIGATGATGVATGDHLHFGISLNGVYVNPCSYVNLR